MDIADQLLVAHAEQERARLRVVELNKRLRKAFAVLADSTERLNELKALAAAGGERRRAA